MAKDASFAARMQRRLDAAQGRRPCDLVIKNTRWLDVFSCRFVEGELAIDDGVIVGVEPGLQGGRELDGKGRTVVPGFIDAHVHVESSMMLPHAFARAVLPRGTTSAVCDPHELANVIGTPGLRYFLTAAERAPLDLWVMLSSCVPATHLETNGGGTISSDELAGLASHPRALGLAEMMNVPGVLAGDEAILKKLEVFAAKPRDGHAPLVSGQALSAYAAVGITSCHESSSYAEAAEKLKKGMAVWIREGSVAKDLQALAPLLTLATSTSIGFCTDDRNPYDIAEEGHLDFLIRGAISAGVAPEVAYRAASLTVARHYGLDRGVTRVGAIAPGYAADLVLLDDVTTCSVRTVLKGGRPVDELEAKGVRVDAANSIRAYLPEARELEGPSGRVHVIGVVAGKIITEARVSAHDASGVARLAVLERYGHGQKPACGYVTGFGQLSGAIASSVGHDSHNLIVVGKDARDMRTALAALIGMGGGFAVVSGGEVRAKLALPIAGLMSEAPRRRPTTCARTSPPSRPRAAPSAAFCQIHSCSWPSCRCRSSPSSSSPTRAWSTSTASTSST
jgi:adenine deaminase